MVIYQVSTLYLSLIRRLEKLPIRQNIAESAVTPAQCREVRLRMKKYAADEKHRLKRRKLDQELQQSTSSGTQTVPLHALSCKVIFGIILILTATYFPHNCYDYIHQLLTRLKVRSHDKKLFAFCF